MSEKKADPYELLGVSRNATKEEIKSAFRKKAIQFHPDKNPEKREWAEAKFKELAEAYEILNDDEKRSLYDQAGWDGIRRSGFSGVNVEDLFSSFSDIFSGGFGDFFGDIFGIGGRRGRRERAERGTDLRYDLEITLEDAFQGKKVEIEVPKHVQCKTCSGLGAKSPADIKTCSTCRGSGQRRLVRSTGFGQMINIITCNECNGIGKRILHKCEDCNGSGLTKKVLRLSIDIPKGIDSGTPLRMSGEGEAGPQGAPQGDLYVVINVKAHPKFERHDSHLVCEQTITFTQAVLGDKIEIDTLDGPTKLTIPPGTKNGTVFRLRDKGMPNFREYGRGDLLCKLDVNIPKKISKDQRDSLEKLKELGL